MYSAMQCVIKCKSKKIISENEKNVVWIEKKILEILFFSQRCFLM